MGTHPIFESDFDCLTEWANTAFPSGWGVSLSEFDLEISTIFSRATEELSTFPSRPNTGSDRRETFYNKPAYKKYGAPEKTRWTVEVDNLSSRCSWQDLKDFMRKVGEVTYGDAHGETGKNRGVVCYEREEEMQRA